MKLTNNLFHIDARRTEGKATAYDLTLHADHFIYQAHFPGQPITPGVCIIQIAKELLEDLLGMPLAVTGVKNAKFLSVLSPTDTPQATFLITPAATADDGTVACSATVMAGGTVTTKLSFLCQKQ